MFDRVLPMLVKEFIELKRDPWAMFRIVVPLVLQVLIYGYAATFTVSHVSTAVLDLDGSQASRDLIARFTANGRFDIVNFAHSQREIAHELDAGRAEVAVVVQAGFAQALGQGSGAPLQVLVDGTNSNTALIALGYISKIVAQYQSDWRRGAWPTHAGAAQPTIAVALQERPWFNEGLDDRWFFIPGVIGTLTLLQVVSLTAFAVVREREVGTLEQIMVSPIRPVEFILGKTAPSLLIGLCDVAIVTSLGIAWFHVPLVGSWLVMMAGVMLFLLAVIGLGLLLSTFSRTQQQAFALNFILLNPIFILSGFAFPISSMPPVLQWLTYLNPLRYFLVVMRAVFLKGVGFAALWPQLAAMAVLAVAMLGASVMRFRKSLD